MRMTGWHSAPALWPLCLLSSSALLGIRWAVLGRKRSCWTMLCSFMVLALPQLAQAAAYLSAQGDVLDTTTYSPGQSPFSLSMEN